MNLILIASKSRTFNAKLNGERVRVTPLQYLCKYGDHLESMSYDPKVARLLQNTIDRVCEAWGRRGPTFLIQCDRNEKPRDGMTVYAYDEGDPVLDDTIPGPIVGTLRKQGRRWVVEPKEAA